MYFHGGKQEYPARTAKRKPIQSLEDRSLHALEPIARTYLQSLRTQQSQVNTTDELSYRDFLSTFFREAAKILIEPLTSPPNPRRIPTDALITKS